MFGVIKHFSFDNVISMCIYNSLFASVIFFLQSFFLFLLFPNLKFSFYWIFTNILVIPSVNGVYYIGAIYLPYKLKQCMKVKKNMMSYE